MGHKNRSTGAESGLCCVSYGVSAVFLWHAHRNRIKALTGGMDNGRLGHLQATCDGADRRHGDLLLVRGGTRCGSVRAAKRIKLSKLKTIKNLVYHFHIPPYQTTAEINQKVVYTTFRPVNGKHCNMYHSDDWYTPNFDGLFGLVVVPALGVGIVLLYLTGERVPDHED